MRLVLADTLVQQAHSTLNPASPQARLVDRLGDSMFLTAAIVFLLVVVALLWAAFRRRGTTDPAARERSR